MPNNDPHYASAYWRAIREQCLARDGYRCRLCNSPDDLQAHHRTYERKGKEDLDDLTTLCQPCHDLVTDHQRRQRYVTRQDPPVQEVETPVAVYVFCSSYKEIALETNCEIPSERRGTALDAQWPIVRSAQRMDKSQKENYGQAEEDGSRPRGNRAPGMDGKPVSFQWSTVHSSRSNQGHAAASSNDVEKGDESKAWLGL